MRHSSWTLFLVPLTLALVLLCTPGTSNRLREADPSAGSAIEATDQESLSELEVPGLSSVPRENASGETSEAFFKD